MNVTEEYIITYEKLDDFAEHICKQSYTDFDDAKDALKRIKELGCFNIKFKRITTEYIDVSKILD
jgi:hypothetical protein